MIIPLQNKKFEENEYVPLGDGSKVFTTYDLGCSAAILCAGFELLSMDKENPRKVLFVFKREEGIEGIVGLYWADRLEIKARAYFDTVKMLKNRIYSE